MIKSVLTANRGEIAIRIARTAGAWASKLMSSEQPKNRSCIFISC
ncbi:MAG: biotin carboxylase N-terminal domain-containing protein [Odoribacter splanchnicus]